MMTPPPLPTITATLILTTSDYIAGSCISRNLGIVRGNSVRTLGVADSFALLGSSGELSTMSKMHDSAQFEAEQQMSLAASKLEANAVTGVRFEIETSSPGLYTVFCYGSAVKITSPVE